MFQKFSIKKIGYYLLFLFFIISDVIVFRLISLCLINNYILYLCLLLCISFLINKNILYIYSYHILRHDYKYNWYYKNNEKTTKK